MGAERPHQQAFTTRRVLHTKGIISPEYQHLEPQIRHAIAHFDNLGHKVGKGRRNMVKHMVVDGVALNVKSFKKPPIPNSLIYRYIRKSKAERSYRYARHLLERGIGTPEPLAYLEQHVLKGLGESYYISLHVQEDLTFRTLIDEPAYPGREEILRQFARFTHRLHEEKIHFLDHSPGNTLIVNENNGKYAFYLVDLNRMQLGRSLGFEARMKNFARLSATKDMIEVISREYALLSNYSQGKIYDRIGHYTEMNSRRRLRQKQLNKRLGKYK